MRTPPVLRLALALFVGLVPLVAAAQDGAVASRSQDLLEEGIEAFRAERYQVALAALEQAVQADPQNAEAYYMMSRVYYETPLFDKGRAGDAIGRARQIDPGNVQYMVAKLQQLRLDSWNNVIELVQHEQRRELARQILSVDSTNAFAHEELGASYIRDFWQYRNAIELPQVGFADPLRDEVDGPDDVPGTPGGVGQDQGSQDPTETLAFGQTDVGNLTDPYALAISDRFDLSALASQGVPVLDLSRRADLAYDIAVHHLERALTYDPRRRPVYDHLMRLYALNEDWEQALGMLERMLVFFPEDPGMWQYLGLVNHRLGRPDASAVSFDEALETMTEEERAAFEDLSYILGEEDRRRYESDPVGFASRYWTSQNPRYLTPYNERKLEHLARLTYADLLYAAPEIGQRGWETERGRIIVRYGPPDVDVVITGAFEEALHNYGVRFDDEARQAGVRYDMAARSNLFNVWDYGDFKFVFEDPLRNGEFRLYSPPAYVFSEAGAGAAEKTDYAIIAENTFRERPEDYDYEASGRVVDVPYLVTAFKGDGGQTDLYVHYGIPLDAGADLSEELLPLTVRTGAFLITEDRDIAVERRRTIYGLRTSQVVDFDEARLWADTEAMEAQPGSHTVSLEFETASGAVQAVQRRDVEVPDFTAGGLALSDPMLAYAVEEVFDEGDEGVSGGLVRRGDFAIQPAPWSVFDAEQPVYVYFETYGLDQNDAGQNQYAVEVTLRPKDTSSGLGRLARSIFGGRDPGVAVEFEAGGTGPDDATYTILDVRDQEPGLYTLTLRVRDAFSGRTTDHTQDLFLE